MLLYPGVMISRTRSRGGLMPVWGDSQRYSIDYSNTAWGSTLIFRFPGAKRLDPHAVRSPPLCGARQPRLD
jgi:outer membrane translocation and assembly module TamA